MGVAQYHCLISGRVQGVSYRFMAQQQAEKLGLTGWVQNLDDGRVEMMIQGQADSVERMLSWAKQGPRFAHVTKLDVEKSNITELFDQFIIN